jgi:hypothetical protein
LTPKRIEFSILCQTRESRNSFEQPSRINE